MIRLYAWTWFGDTPVRTLADKERDERQQNSRVAKGNPRLAMATVRDCESSLQNSQPRIRAESLENGDEVGARDGMHGAATLDPFTAAATECERQARSLFADRILQPDEIRKKYPAGWLRAGYVAAPAQLLGARDERGAW